MRSAVGRLLQRREFLRVAGASKRGVTPGLVLQARSRPRAEADCEGPLPRVGFTASRKVGGAVARNRARRRLRAAVDQVMPMHAMPEKDYVVIARKNTVSRPFGDLLADLEKALRQVGAWRDGAGEARP